MKLKTKRNRLYFRRELFLYLIPMLFIVGSVDTFSKAVKCGIHPERSISCELYRWLPAAVYAFCIIISIVLYVIFARKLHKVKEQIEQEFQESVEHEENKKNEKIKELKDSKPKKNIAKKEIKTDSKLSKKQKKSISKWSDKN